MTKLALVLAAGVLAASSAAVAQDSAESVAGRYKVVRADGSGFISVINADGTYSEVVDGVTTVTGSWKAEGERTCYDPDGDEGRTCYSFGEPVQPAEEGSFAARSDKGEVFTVRRID